MLATATPAPLKSSAPRISGCLLSCRTRSFPRGGRRRNPGRVPPGVTGPGFFRRQRDQLRSIEIAWLISWRGRWYVVPFGAVRRNGARVWLMTQRPAQASRGRQAAAERFP
jgi:hypothetical protein